MNRGSFTIESQSPRESGHNAQPKEPKRPYLDSLRGLAAIVVVSTHFCKRFTPTPYLVATIVNNRRLNRYSTILPSRLQSPATSPSACSLF